MKKLMISMLAVAMAFCATACNDDDDDDKMLNPSDVAGNYKGTEVWTDLESLETETDENVIYTLAANSDATKINVLAESGNPYVCTITGEKTFKGEFQELLDDDDLEEPVTITTVLEGTINKKELSLVFKDKVDGRFVSKSEFTGKKQ